MSPGAACGDPRAAPGYLEHRRRAPGESPGCGGNPALTGHSGGPGPPKNYKLVAMGYKLSLIHISEPTRPY